MAYDPTQDPACKVWYRLEDGALTYDSTGKGNVLHNEYVTADTGDYQEGAASAYFEESGYNYPILELWPADQAADFPTRSGEVLDEITLCVRFKLNSDSSISRQLLAQGGRFSVQVYDYTPLKLEFSIYTSSGWQYITHDSTIEKEKWYYVACSFDNSDSSFRVRIFDVTADAILGTDKTGFFAGTATYSSSSDMTLGDDMEGWLDDFLFFDSILSVESIDKVFDQTFGEAPPLIVTPDKLSMHMAVIKQNPPGSALRVRPETLSLSIDTVDPTLSRTEWTVNPSTLSMSINAHLTQFNDGQILPDLISDDVDTSRVAPTLDQMPEDWVPGPSATDVEFIVGAINYQNNLPITVEPRQTVAGQIMLSYVDDFYYRIHTYPPRLDLGPVLTTVDADLMVWNAFFETKTCSSLSQVGTTVTLNGLTPPFDLRQLEHTLYDLTLGETGSPTIETTITWDFDSAGTGIIIITGTRMTVLPYPPMLGMLERLEWLTDILTAIDGSEQRFALRIIPRQSFELTIPIQTEAEQQRFDAAMLTWQKQYWGFPVWGERIIHTNTITAGDTSITMDVSYADYQDSGLAIIWQDETSYEIVNIDTVDSGGLTLVTAVVNTWTGSMFIMPVRSCRMQQTVEKTDQNKGVAYYRISLMVTDSVEITGYVASTTYKSLPVLTKACIVRPTRRVVNDPDVTIIDYLTGPQQVLSTSDNVKITQGYLERNDSRAECWEWRQFLHYMKGRRGLCYIPTWKEDATLTQTIGPTDTSFNVTNKGLAANIGSGNDIRKEMCFELTDGTLLFREVTGISIVDSSTETITIDSALGYTLDNEDVVISWMDKCRLNSDRVEKQWLNPAENETMTEFLAVAQ